MSNGDDGTLYYGKYRGSVVDNVDPERRGRLKIQAAGVKGGKTLTWAEACLPLAGPAGAGMGIYAVPPKNAAVWVEFEEGNTDHPIWTGCLFEASVDVPPPALAPGMPDARVVVQTQGRNSVTISDVPGEGLVLRAQSGASIVVNEQGITISTGKGASIKLTGNRVNVNEGALEIV